MKMFLSTVSLLLFLTSTAYSAPISVQGVLRDANNRAVEDGEYVLTFEIFSDETGGSSLWGPSDKTATLLNGVYNLELDLNNDLQSSGSECGSELWLAVSVDSEPMNSRVRLHLSPYEQLELSGNGNVVLESGNVGLGTLEPSNKLEVRGQISTTSSGSNLNMRIGINDISVYDSHPDAGTVHDGDGTAVAAPLYLQYWSTGNTILNATGGNVGIGTNNPQSYLHIVGDPGIPVDTHNGSSLSSFAQINLTTKSNASNGVAGNLKIGYDPDYGTFGVGFIQTIVPNIYASALSLNPTGGNVGIGTTSPSQKLHVNGSIRSDGAVYANSLRNNGNHLEIFSDNVNFRTNDDSGPGHLVTGYIYLSAAAELRDHEGWYSSNVQRYAVDPSSHSYFSNTWTHAAHSPGALTQYDYRDGESQIENNLLNKLSQLKTISSTRNSEYNIMGKNYALDVEDVKNQFPELLSPINQSEDYVIDENTNYGLNMTKLSVLTVGAVNELKAEKDAEIQALNRTIEDLLNRIESLENR